MHPRAQGITPAHPQKRKAKTPWHMPRTQTDATLPLPISSSSNLSTQRFPQQQKGIRNSRLMLKGPDSFTNTHRHPGCTGFLPLDCCEKISPFQSPEEPTQPFHIPTSISITSSNVTPWPISPVLLSWATSWCFCRS